MSRFLIRGRKTVKGVHRVPGNKNAALPMIAAALLTTEKVVLENVPQIADVERMLECAASFGVEVVRDCKARMVTLCAAKLRSKRLDPTLASRIRTSILFAGPLLARMGKVVLPLPGGDDIGHRRLDTHFDGLCSLGAKFSSSRRGIRLEASELSGTKVLLDEASVTATENILMAAVLAKGNTVIYNAACEPHVQNLCDLLIAMGAEIDGVGTNLIRIRGVESLHGATLRVRADYIEAVSYMTAAAVTGGELVLTEVDADDFYPLDKVLRRFGLRWTVNREARTIMLPAKQRLKLAYDFGDTIPSVADGPWPMFPSDLMSVLIVLATQTHGTCLFHEKLFESRLYFVDHLVQMGAKIVVCDPHRCVVTGPTRLNGTTVTSPDIRAGIALVVAALCAKGETTILNADSVDRGYEQVEQELASLGADVRRSIG